MGQLDVMDKRDTCANCGRKIKPPKMRFDFCCYTCLYEFNRKKEKAKENFKDGNKD